MLYNTSRRAVILFCYKIWHTGASHTQQTGVLGTQSSPCCSASGPSHLEQVTKAGPWMTETSPFTFARRLPQCLSRALSLWLLEPHTWCCGRKEEKDIQLCEESERLWARLRPSPSSEEKHFSISQPCCPSWAPQGHPQD